MKNEGWTLGDLASELLGRGIDIEDVPISKIMEHLKESVEQASREISLDYRYGESD